VCSFLTAHSPDRPNIFVEVHNRGTSFETELAWLLDVVIEKHLDCPKTGHFRQGNQHGIGHLWLDDDTADRESIH